MTGKTRGIVSLRCARHKDPKRGSDAVKVIPGNCFSAMRARLTFRFVSETLADWQ